MTATLWEDLRDASRGLIRNPGFSILAATTLAVGIGANVAVFSLVNAVLLRPLPFRNPDRLAFVSVDPSDAAGGIYYDDHAVLAAQTAVFEGVAWYYRNSGWSRVTLTGSEPETAQGAFVSANLFPLMGVTAAIGRTLDASDEARREHVVVLSDRFWRRRFGGSPAVVGRSLQIDGASAEIVGVMPAAFQFPARDVQFWAPISINRFWDDPAVRVQDPSHNRFFYTRWQAVARLEAGVTLRQAQAALDTLPNDSARLNLIPVRIEVAADARLTLMILLGAVSSVLLIACANIANLVLARGAGRRRELAIRLALGGSRGRLVRQLFTESALLALLAAVLGLGAAALATPALARMGPADIPRLDETSIDRAVLAFTSVLTTIAAALFGLAPAWKISRGDPNDALKSGTAGSGQAASAMRMRRLLIVVEFGLSVMLLSAAGLFVRSLLAAQAVDPGFQPERMLTMRITMPAGTTDRRARAFADEVQQRILALPGVLAAGAINGLFQLGPPGNFGLRSIDGMELSEGPNNWSAPLSWCTVSGDYFQAMGARLLSGRLFSVADGPGAPLVAVVDESLVHRYWPGQDPIGQRFKGQDARGKSDDWVTIVGVVGGMRRHGLERQPLPQVYLPQRQEGDLTPDLVVRVAGDAQPLAGLLRDVVRSLDAAAILSPVTTLEQQIDRQLAARRFQSWLLGLFSLTALGLAGVGIYGVMHCAVAERRREIGIRMALGAQRSTVLGMMIREALRLAAFGLAAGLAGAFWVSRLIANLLFGITSWDPPSFAAAAAFLLVVAVLASAWPAWRAARVDPLVALRQE